MFPLFLILKASLQLQEDFKEIAFYEFAAAPVYPEFEFQLVNDHKRGSDNAS